LSLGERYGNITKLNVEELVIN